MTDNRDYGIVPGSNIRRGAEIAMLLLGYCELYGVVDFLGRDRSRWAVNPHENVRRGVYSAHAINRFR